MVRLGFKIYVTAPPKVVDSKISWGSVEIPPIPKPEDITPAKENPGKFWGDCGKYVEPPKKLYGEFEGAKDAQTKYVKRNL